MRKEEKKFINEGRQRIMDAVGRFMEKKEQALTFGKFPKAAEYVAIGYIPFALSALPPYQDIEVNGLPWFVKNLLPHPLLIACKWEEAVDWTLARTEKDYLRYLGYKSWFWWEGFHIPEENKGNLLLNEALLDTLQEDGDQTEITKEVFAKGRLNKYLRAIRLKWETGCHFEILRSISPAGFGLPELGSRAMEEYTTQEMPSTREQAVLQVLAKAYNLESEDRNSEFVTLRRIAEEESLPYSIILKAKNNAIKNK